jgi:membrane protease YdiL (CAAX protease family)
LTPPLPRVAIHEVLVVFGVTAGIAILSHLGSDVGARNAVAFTDGHLYGLVIYEVAVAAALVPWLARRGWTPRAVAGTPAPSDLVQGAGVWFLALACYYVVWALFAILQPHSAAKLAAEHRFNGLPAGAAMIIIASLLNPVFEEMLWLGYGVGRLATRVGLRTAAVVSIVLRVAVHAYQGPWAILSILPVGVAFTWYYGRTRRLWPVIVAHVLFDAIGLAQRLGK